MDQHYLARLQAAAARDADPGLADRGREMQRTFSHGLLISPGPVFSSLGDPPGVAFGASAEGPMLTDSAVSDL